MWLSSESKYNNVAKGSQDYTKMLQSNNIIPHLQYDSNLNHSQLYQVGDSVSAPSFLW